MGRLNTDRSTGDKNSCHSQDVTVASYDPIVKNTSIHGLQKSSSDGSISLTGSRTLTGPVAVLISSSGKEKLIQVSVVVADTAIVDRSIEGLFLISLYSLYAKKNQKQKPTKKTVFQNEVIKKTES